MEWKYTAVLTGEQFLYYEIRIVSQLLCEGLTRDEIRKKIKEENLFQFPTERKVREITNACFKRIDALNSKELVECIANSSVDVGKQINMYAIMKTYRIVWDFMITVIGEKYEKQDFTFSQVDLNMFFMRLREQDDTVATWKDRTISELKGMLRRALIACEYLDNIKSDRLNAVWIVPELEDEIKKKGDYKALSAFNCFR